MTREKFVAWTASFLCALVVGLVVGVLDGPTWAMAGFAILAFYTFRLRDRLT